MKTARLPLCFLFSFFTFFSWAQTAFTGDNFGGRLWYQPTNYSVGSYSAHAVCGNNFQLYSWGTNEHGELGIQGTLGASEPILIPGMDQIYYYSAGYVAGAIKFDKSGWVWGKHFQLPTKVIDDVKYVDAGQNAVTFIKSDGTVWSVGYANPGCFGNNWKSEFLSIEPVQMHGIEDAVRVANGKQVTLILLKDGTVMTCGNNSSRGLSMFTEQVIAVPKKIEGLKNIVAIAAARTMNFALDKDGNVYQWGTWYQIPVPLGKVEGLRNIVAISSRNDGAHAMALDASGLVYAWGENYYHNQLGNGTKENNYVPTVVASDAIDILAGESFSYVVKSDMTLWACGASTYGSIYLDQPNKKRTHYVQLHPEKLLKPICKPFIADFQNYEKFELEFCGDTFFTHHDLQIRSDTSVFDTFTNRFGFDSIVEFALRFNVFSKAILKITICEGDYLDMFDRSFLRSGTYYDSTISSTGCDSITELRLTVLKRSAYFQEVHLCQKDRITVGPHTYSEPGEYLDSFKNKNGCDSLVITKVIAPHTDSQFVSASICDGDFLYIDNWAFHEPGKHELVLVNRNGCDSIIFIDLEVRDRSIVLQKVDLCFEDSFTVGNSVYFESGKYFDTLQNSLHCDSIIVTIINKLPFNIRFENHYKCEFDTLALGDSMYPTFGLYSQTFESYQSCDSVVMYNILTLPLYECWGGNIFIPNAFTPNGDPHNNTFTYVAQNVVYAHLEIYNRWGELLYSEYGPHPAWDGIYEGEVCQNGVYVYKLYVEYEDLEPATYTGTVTLIR